MQVGLGLALSMCIPYSAKFSRRLIFAVFADSFPSAKIKLCETSIPCLVWFPDHSARSLV